VVDHDERSPPETLNRALHITLHLPSCGSRNAAGCSREQSFHEGVCAGRVRVSSDFATTFDWVIAPKVSAPVRPGEVRCSSGSQCRFPDCTMRYWLEGARAVPMTPPLASTRSQGVSSRGWYRTLVLWASCIGGSLR